MRRRPRGRGLSSAADSTPSPSPARFSRRTTSTAHCDSGLLLSAANAADCSSVGIAGAGVAEPDGWTLSTAAGLVGSFASGSPGEDEREPDDERERERERGLPSASTSSSTSLSDEASTIL